jgi:multicomponent Na+:H+ antiporter subunit C
MEFIEEYIVPNFNYWIYIVLMMIGLYAMIVKNNLIKKLIGMSIFQTAIILFYVSIGVKAGADIPILEHDAAHAEEHHPGDAGEAEKKEGEREGEVAAAHGAESAIRPDDYANPLPHVLMLTAIVVGVATLGVGLAVVQKIYRDYGTLEEDEILGKIKAADD